MMSAYFLIIILSVISNFVGFVSGSILGNIVHVRNNREPNAGSSIFPTIPVSQFFYCGLAWVGNTVRENSGFWLVIFFIISLIIYGAIKIKKDNKVLEELTKKKPY